jgi:uncharacterized membrane protein
MTKVYVYLTTLVAFLALDAIWLGLVSPPVYQDTLKGLLLDSFRPLPAVLFYLLYVAGIVVFVLPLGRRHASIFATAAYAAFFGLCAYGTYDLTNQAVLKAWTTELTVTDLAWGAVVTTLASLAGAALDRRLTPGA